jgi:hypothetical protein
MKKKQLNQIKRTAEGLPPMHQIVNQYARLKGEELKKNGVMQLKDGGVVDDGKIYISVREDLHTINHRRRIKKQFQRYGMAGVISYRRAVLEYAEQNKNKTANYGQPDKQS